MAVWMLEGGIAGGTGGEDGEGSVVAHDDGGMVDCASFRRSSRAGC
jgi:hypothetical protein